MNLLLTLAFAAEVRVPSEQPSIYDAVLNQEDGLTIIVEEDYDVFLEFYPQYQGMCINSNGLSIVGEGASPVTIPAVWAAGATDFSLTNVQLLSAPIGWMGCDPSGNQTANNVAKALWLDNATATLQDVQVIGVTADAGDQGYTIYADNSTLTADNLSLIDNSGVSTFALKFIGGSLTLTGCTITGNDAGVATKDTATVSLEGCEIANPGVTAASVADLYVGGAQTLTVEDTRFGGSTANTYGSVLLDDTTEATFTGGSFEATRSGNHGGALTALGGTVTISGTSFAETSALEGGAIFAEDVELELEGVTVTGSSAETAGGFLSQSGGTVTMSGSTLLDTRTTGEGHAMRLTKVDALVTGSTLCGGGGEASGTLHSTRGSLRVAGSVFQALEGAGIYVSDGADLTVLNADFLGSGAGVRGSPDRIELVNTIFAENLVGLDLLDAPTGSTRLGWNLWYGNAADQQGATLETDGESLQEDPAFVSTFQASVCGSAPRVKSGSPVIDAGDPDIEDLDGSRSDIGAYGGTNPLAGEGVDTAEFVDGDSGFGVTPRLRLSGGCAAGAPAASGVAVLLGLLLLRRR